MQALIVGIEGSVLIVARNDGTTWRYTVKPHELTYHDLPLLQKSKEEGAHDLGIATFEQVPGEKFQRLVGLAL